MSAKTRIRQLLLPALALLVVLVVAGCGESSSGAASKPPDDIVFTIERGALAQHMRGEISELIPSRIDLVAGQKIVIHNQDDALHYFLSEPIWPGETLVTPFDAPGIYRFDGAFTCSIGAITSLTVYVAENSAGAGA